MTQPVAPGGLRLPPSPPLSPGGQREGAKRLTPGGSPANSYVAIDRTKVDPAMVEAAEGMETMFIDYMMKVMRDTVPKNEMDLESPATNIYRGMLDSEYAKSAARAGGVGLADQIIAYLQSQSYTKKEEQAAPALSTGGTHEGQSKR